jgi:type IV fimbrial biogenesis protein FimT
MLSRTHRTTAGFTLVELMVAIALLATLLKLAAPSFVTWSRNAQVRTVADSLQSAARNAQNEATRRSRQVVLSLTNETPGVSSKAVANGVNYAVHVVPLPGESLEFVQGGVLSDVASASITGPKSICFNSIGRLVANAAPGVTDAVCTVSATAPLATYDVTLNGADRPLRVTVALGGRVRMCDPNRSIAAGAPEGCE